MCVSISLSLSAHHRWHGDILTYTEDTYTEDTYIEDTYIGARKPLGSGGLRRCVPVVLFHLTEPFTFLHTTDGTATS